jgi:hypothetical protein
MYIVLAEGRDLPDAVANLRPQELAGADGERMFVLKRDLKKD